MIDPIYDYLCSIGELIDKLSIENIKCYHANNEIMRIRDHPAGAVDAQRVSDLEQVARSAGEQRVRLRDEVNRRLAEAIDRGGMRAVQDVRTYDFPPEGRPTSPPTLAICGNCGGVGSIALGALNPNPVPCGVCNGTGRFYQAEV